MFNFLFAPVGTTRSRRSTKPVEPTKKLPPRPQKPLPKLPDKKKDTKTKTDKKEPGKKKDDKKDQEQSGQKKKSTIPTKVLNLVGKIMGPVVKKLLAEEKDIRVGELLAKIEIPGVISYDKFPSFIKDTFKDLIITTPKVAEDSAGLYIKFTLPTFVKNKTIKERLGAKLRIFEKSKYAQKKGKGFAIMINFGKDFKLSDLFPGAAKKLIKKIEFIEVKEGVLVLANGAYDDPDLGHIAKGVDVIGQLGLTGWGKTFNHLLGGIPEKISPRIALKLNLPGLSGSKLQLSFPFGITLLPLPLLPKNKQPVPVDDSLVRLGPLSFGIEIEDILSLKGISLELYSTLILQLIPSFVKANKNEIIALLNQAKTQGVDTVLNRLKGRAQDLKTSNKKLVLTSIRERIQYQTELEIHRAKANLEDEIDKVKKKVAQEELNARIKRVKDNKFGKGNIYKDFLFAPIEVTLGGEGNLDLVKVSGQTKGTLYNLFGIQGLNGANVIAGFQLDLSKYVGLLASVLGIGGGAAAGGAAGAPTGPGAAATSGIGATVGGVGGTISGALSFLRLFIPDGITLGGRLEYGKSSLDATGSITFGEKVIDEFALALSGSLFLRDLVKVVATPFLDIAQLDKEKKDVDKFIDKFVPNMQARDVVVNIVPFATEFGKEEVPSHIKGKVGKLEIIPGVIVGGEIYISKSSGIKIDGYAKDFVLPPKGKPIFTLSGTKKGKGPRFEISYQIPLAFSAGLDGRLELDMGPLGKVVSATNVSLSTTGLEAHLLTKLLDLYESELKLKVALSKGRLDAKNFFVDITFQTGGLEALNNFLNKVGPQALEGLKKKFQGDLDKASRTLNNEIRNQAKNLKNKANDIKSRIKNLKSRKNDFANKASSLFKQAGKSLKNIATKCWKKRKIGLVKVPYFDFGCAKNIKRDIENMARTAKGAAESLGRQIGGFTGDVAKLTASATQLYGVSVAQGFTEATRQTVKTFAGPALKVYEEAYNGLKAVTDQMAQISKKGFEINYVNAKGSLADVYNVGATVKGKVLGKPFELKTPGLGFLKTPLEGAKVILKKVGVKI